MRSTPECSTHARRRRLTPEGTLTPEGKSPCGRLGAVKQAVRERVVDELRTALEPELLHHVRAMRLRRPDGDEELLRDLLVGEAACQKHEHLVLALRERVFRRLLQCLGLGRDEPC